MKLIRRLYLKDFFTLLCLLSLGLSLIFSLIDLTGKMDDFSHGRASAGVLVRYALFSVPRFFVYLLPMAVLISSLFTFSQAHRRKEITAIKAAGGRLRTLFYPFVATGILLGLLAFATEEIIVPDFSKRAVELKNSFSGKGKRLAFNEGSLWIRARDGSPVKIDLYIAEKKMAKGINIFILDKDFLRERIFAEKASWDGTAWTLEDVTRYDIASGSIEKVKAMGYPDIESPDLFTEGIKTTDEMGIAELYRYNQRLKNAGFRNIKLAVDLNSKISFPAINVFMMLLGLSLSLMGRRGGGLFSAGLGLLISLLYWFGYTFLLSMGYAGILPPLLAAWAVPLVFGAFSVYLFRKIPE
jgi:lipopolysaccharide export system permease protein